MGPQSESGVLNFLTLESKLGSGVPHKTRSLHPCILLQQYLQIVNYDMFFTLDCVDFCDGYLVLFCCSVDLIA